VAAAGRVEWSPRALRDLIAIFRVTAADNPTAAAEQSEHIIERAEALVRYRRLGRVSPWRGRRVLILTRYPYSIYYRTLRSGARVLRIVHQRRRFP
jgi:plasmid stabilization system protein ParE